MMAVLEQSSKTAVDDTIVLSCTIEAAHNLKDHTEYVIRVQRGPVAENSWTVSRRYSQFASLHSELTVSGISLPLPPKKILGKMDREFIAQRQQGLQHFLDAVLRYQILANSRPVKVFLDEANYSTNLQEAALQHISMFFRSESHWEVIEPLPDIGWRLRKKYFLIKNKFQSKERYVLSWSQLGPDRHLSDKDLSLCMKMLSSFQHPHLCPVIFATCNDTCAITIRHYYTQGTLRDYICKCKPKQHFLKKYGSPKFCQMLHFCDIQRYGKQLLETLKYLHSKGYYYGHLHAGNVLIDADDKCQLLDLENSILGLPSVYRPFFTQYRKIQSLEAVDVYCFGQLLYEMTFGRALNEPTCNNFPYHCPPDLRSVLESILTTEACKNGLPSVSDLLQHPLFQSVVLPPLVEKIHIKIPSKLKQPLKDAFQAAAKHLENEQKLIHHYHRISKAQAYHMSEEEKKKRRLSKRKQLLEQQQSAEVSNINSHNDSHNIGVTSNDNRTDSHDSSLNSHSMDVDSNSVCEKEAGKQACHLSNASDTCCHDTSGSDVSSSLGGRGALLQSINHFSKSALKHVVTCDKENVHE